MIKTITKSVLLIMLISVMVVPAVLAEENEDEYLWELVNDRDEDVKFTGRWTENDDVSGVFGDTSTSTYRESAYVEFTFEGSGVRWVGPKGMNMGEADVYLNNELVEKVNARSDNNRTNQVVFEKKDLKEGEHTIKIDPRAEPSDMATLNLIGIEAMGYIPTEAKSRQILEDTIESAQKTLYQVPDKPKMNPGNVLQSFYTEQNKNKLIDAVVEGLFKLSADFDVEDYMQEINDLNKEIDEFKNSEKDIQFIDKGPDSFDGVVRYSPVWETGKIENGIQLDGESDYIDIPNEIGLFDGTNDLTIESWFYPHTLPEEDNWQVNEMIISFRGEHSLSLTFGDSNDPESLSVRGDLEESGWTTIVKTPELETEQWYHIAAVYDSDEGWELYLDGENVDSSSNTEVVKDRGDNNMIGGDAGGENRYFDGIIDEVRIWNTTRGQDEIEESMEESLTGNEEGLAAYWDFEEVEVLD